MSSAIESEEEPDLKEFLLSGVSFSSILKMPFYFYFD